MLASTTEPLSGRCTIRVTFPEDAAQAEPDQTASMLQAFLLGIDWGFFDASPALPATRGASSTVWERTATSLCVHFVASQLPGASFAILNGLFAGYALHLGAEVASALATLEGQPGNLLTVLHPPLPPLEAIPFTTDLPDGPNEGKSLRVWLDFVAPIPQDERDGLINLFSVWDALVLGPFPAPERAVGESWSGPAETSFLLSSRLEHFVEDYESGPEAFELLIRALLRVHRRFPIEHLEVE